MRAAERVACPPARGHGAHVHLIVQAWHETYDQSKREATSRQDSLPAVER